MRHSDTDSISGIFNGTITENGPVVVGQQTFTQAAGTFGTISATGPWVVIINGGTGGGTLNLPASPQVGQIYSVGNTGSAQCALSGNGINIEANATIQMYALGGGFATSSCMIRYDGTQWRILSACNCGLGLVIANLTTFGSNTNLNSTLTTIKNLAATVQSFATNGASQSIAVAGGSIVRITGSTAASTIVMPSSPNNGQVYFIKNNSSVNVTLQSASGTFTGSATVTAVAGSHYVVCWNSTTTDWELLA